MTGTGDPGREADRLGWNPKPESYKESSNGEGRRADYEWRTFPLTGLFQSLEVLYPGSLNLGRLNRTKAEHVTNGAAGPGLDVASRWL